jgi:hypothetical protein
MSQAFEEKIIMFNSRSVLKKCRQILKIKDKNDVGFYYDYSSLSLVVLDKEDMNDNMKRWKDLAKQGKIQMYAKNNKEYDIGSKKVYTLVMSPLRIGWPICPISEAWRTTVNGTTFVFTKKENRDAVYGYVKKFCLEEKNE